MTLLVAALSAAAAVTSCSGGRAATATPGSTTTTTAPDPMRGLVVPTSKLDVRQCVKDLPSAEQRPYAVLVVPCGEPHLYEIFYRGAIGGAKPPGADAEYPGELAVANQAEQQCVDAFAGYVGTAWSDSDYDFQAWWPSGASWTDRGDRTVTCGAFRYDGGTTEGSISGSGK
ncbi:MAG: septum formation family protein [Microthrixaceae bacterium]